MNIFQIIPHLSQACQNCTTNPAFLIKSLFSLGLGFSRTRETQINPLVNKLITERVLNDKPVMIKIEGSTVKEFVNEYQALFNSQIVFNQKDNNTIGFKLIEKFFLFYWYLFKVTPKHVIDSIGLVILKNNDQEDNITDRICDRLHNIGILSQMPVKTDKPIIRILCNQLLIVAGPFGIQSQEPFTIVDKFNFLSADKEVEKTFKQLIQIGEILTNNMETFTNNIPEVLLMPQAALPKKARQNPMLRKRIYQTVSKNRPQLEKDLSSLSKEFYASITQSNNNKSILFIFKHLEAIHPSQFIAYLYFEKFLNFVYASITGKDTFQDSHRILKAQQSLNRAMIIECLTLLFPYAQNVTQQFGIDLANDEKLKNLLETKGFLNKLSQKIEKYENELNKIQQKSSFPNQDSLPEINEPFFNCHTAIDSTIKSKDKDLTKNLNITTKSSQEKRLKIVVDYQVTQAEIISKEKKRQIEKIKTFYDLPSRTFVNTIIKNLSTNNNLYFNMLFGQISNNMQMTNDNLENLTNAICKDLVQAKLQCALSFKKEVEARRHERHTGGKKLPQHWLDLRRSTFIIFGIFPENWEPKTKEDRDAMAKYDQRCLDKEYFDIYQKNFVK